MSSEDAFNALAKENYEAVEETISSITAIKGEKFTHVVRALHALMRVNDLAAHATGHCEDKACAGPLMLGFLTGFAELGTMLHSLSGLDDKDWQEAADWMAKLHERDELTKQRVSEVVKRRREE